MRSRPADHATERRKRICHCLRLWQPPAAACGDERVPNPPKNSALSSQGFRAAQVPSDKEKREFKVTHMPTGRMPELMAGVGGPRLFSRHPGRTAASSVCAIFDLI